jgi:hypothetical protein
MPFQEMWLSCLKTETSSCLFSSIFSLKFIRDASDDILYDITYLGSLNPMNTLRYYAFQRTLDFGDSDVALFQSKLAAALSLFPAIGRLLLTLTFLGSFLLRPLQQPISTFWARVVESDKPVFTLVIGGGAAFAEALVHIAKIF